MKSTSFLTTFSFIVAAAATGYQLVVIALQPVLSSREQQRSLAAVFRSCSLVLVSLFLVITPGHRTRGSRLSVNLTLELGLLMLIVGAPGYELLVHIHDSNQEKESLNALEQEGRLLVLSVCGMLMIVMAQIANFLLGAANGDAQSKATVKKVASVKDLLNEAHTEPVDGDSSETDDHLVVPKRLRKKSPWDDIIRLGRQDLLKFMDAKDWLLKEESGDLKVWRKETPMLEGGVRPIKVSGVVEGVDPYTLCTCFQSLDFKKSSSETIKELRIVENCNENTKLYYQQDQYPWPLANRESLFISTVHELVDKETMVLAEWSVPNHPDVDLADDTSKDIVRVQTYSVVTFSKHGDGGDSLVTVASSIDVGGLIPRFVVEEEVKKLPKLFEEVSEVIHSEQGRETFREVTAAVNRALWTELLQEEITPLQRNFLRNNCPVYPALLEYLQ